MQESINACLQRAIAFHNRGELSEAAALYAQVIERDRTQPDALHLLGVACTQAGQFERGAMLIEQSLSRNPQQPVALANLGNAQFSLNRFESALTSYDRSIALSPGNAITYNGRGNALSAMNRLEHAVASFTQALTLAPDLLEAANNRGLALLKLRRFDEAIRDFTRVLAKRSDDVSALAGRALACYQISRHADALADADRALQLQPALTEARYARCAALLSLMRLQELLTETDRRLADDPDDPLMLYFRASAQARLGRRADAIRDFERALTNKPDFPDVLFELGTLQIGAQHYDRAAALFERLVAAAPEHDFAQGAWLHADLHICNWSRYDSAVERILAGVDRGAKMDLPLSFNAISDDPKRQLQCARTYARDLPVPGSDQPAVAPRAGARRLRIAYISADFLEHPTAYLIAGLIESHDRNRFEIIAVSLRQDPESPTARRLRAGFDRFFDVSDQSDEAVASLLRELEVDIAVDLMGYTGASRCGILMSRPAPIQVSYLGYPATMGADHIDYLIADPFVIPAESAPFYSESIVYLPGCFQANDRRRFRPDTPTDRSLLGLPADAFVFCAFHASFKISPALFDVWTRLLHAVPGSVLWLVANSLTAESNLRNEARLRGIDPERLVFATRAPYPEHLSRLGAADLCLDTWPFNGGATTSDALWCGVPMVTRVGASFTGRMSGSLLQAVGLPELATASFEDYAEVAIRLATDPSQMAEIRARLRQGRDTGSLFDTDRFRRSIESAYEAMWQRHQRGERPTPLMLEV